MTAANQSNKNNTNTPGNNTPLNSSAAQGSYTHNGWPVSPFSQKTLAYLKYKSIPHQDQAPNFYQLMVRIPKKVGRAIMPTVVTPEGEWLQDTADIIDQLEKRFPQHSIEPSTAKQQLVARLLEMHADEWLVLSALHYRWTEPATRDFIVNAFGQYALPMMPGFIRRMAGNRIRKAMMSYLPRFGIVGKTEPGVRRYTQQLIARLEEHFQQYKYFLGNRPCVGDFAFFGQLYAHLYRDPGSTHLFDQTPNLVLWMQRLLNADGSEATPADGVQYRFLPDDEIPATLLPIIEMIFAEHFPFCIDVVKRINEYVTQHPEATRVPRVVGDSHFTIGGITGERKQLSFTQWKVQRCCDVYHSASDTEKAELGQWLATVGGEALLSLNIEHPLKRQNYREVLANRS